ncbi:MAG TPA: hypothetical protein VMV17_08380 [Streptosporangiaceae bacterium]|nr:hypothetical protein [Streptosporangiaceae bacterium]
MILIGLIIVTAVLIVLAVPRIWRMLSPSAAGQDQAPRLNRSGDSMNVFISRDLEAADRLALARLDDDGAPPASGEVAEQAPALLGAG